MNTQQALALINAEVAAHIDGRFISVTLLSINDFDEARVRRHDTNTVLVVPIEDLAEIDQTDIASDLTSDADTLLAEAFISSMEIDEHDEAAVLAVLGSNNIDDIPMSEFFDLDEDGEDDVEA